MSGDEYMTKIKALKLDQIDAYLSSQKPAWGSVHGVMLHHTASPTKCEGIKTVENIGKWQMTERKPVSNDIMANFYVDTATIYTARPLSAPNWAHGYVSKPWSQVPSFLKTMCNGNRMYPNRYLIGIETFGNFDDTQPDLNGPMGMSIKLIAKILKYYDLPSTHIFFHRDVTNDKECPGKNVSHEFIKSEVDKILAGGVAAMEKIFWKNAGKEINCLKEKINGNVYVGIRTFVEALGGKVDYDPKTNTITIDLKVIQ